MLFCLVYLRWVFMKGVFAVGSEAVAVCDIIIFKNIAFCRNCLLCLFWACFWLRDCVGCLLWFFCDWFYDWLMRWFVVFVLKVCFLNVFDWVVAGIVFSDCLIWLIVPVGCFFVEWLWFCEKEKDYGRTCIAMLPLLNPVSKWVRSDSNGWSFNLGVYCLLWKRFCVLNVALRMTKKLNRLRNSDGYVLVFKKTQRVVWPCFNCADFMAQTAAA